MVAKYRETREAGSGIHILFLDQEKAYNRIDYQFLWKVIKTIGILPEFIG
jgi:hypothetical protein